MDKDVAAYTFGIEEEFFLVDRRTRHTMPGVSQRFVEECRRRLRHRVTCELQQTQVEIPSPVFSSGEQALHVSARLRDGVADIAGEKDMGIVAAGSHPLAAWRRHLHTAKPRYARIMREFQIVGRRDVLCGLHVHVAVREGDRVVLMNRIMPWLPLFAALSTSSPFWNRERTGLMGYRGAVHDEWPRMGIPDFFDDERDYGVFVDRLVRAGAIEDGSELWWAIRPSLHYPTLELRIADSCTHLHDAVAIASLFRCLVRAHVRRPRLGATRSNATRRLIDENRWRALRYGLRAMFIDEARDDCVTVAQQLAEVRELVKPDAAALGAGAMLDHLDRILERGTSADRQLAVYDARRKAGASHLEALKAVVDWLLATTSPTQGARRPAMSRPAERAFDSPHGPAAA